MSERVERRGWVPATAEQVWDVITRDGWLADEVRLDLRPGGDAEFRSGPDTKTGWVEEARPPRGEGGAGRLTFWWASDGEPATRVELTLEPGDRIDDVLALGGTRLRVVESRPLDALDLVGMPLPGVGGKTFGPALVAA
jgi:hypothetical protein